VSRPHLSSFGFALYLTPFLSSLSYIAPPVFFHFLLLFGDSPPPPPSMSPALLCNSHPFPVFNPFYFPPPPQFLFFPGIRMFVELPPFSEVYCGSRQVNPLFDIYCPSLRGISRFLLQSSTHDLIFKAASFQLVQRNPPICGFLTSCSPIRSSLQ